MAQLRDTLLFLEEENQLGEGNGQVTAGVMGRGMEGRNSREKCGEYIRVDGQKKLRN